MKIPKQTIIPALLVSLPVIFMITDKLWGKFEAPRIKNQQAQVEVGDIIFRTNSYILSGSKYYYKAGMPGHLAIAVSAGTWSANDESLRNIDVVESAMYNRTQKKFQANVSFNKANENFGNLRGRRFLLKMHLTPEQKEKLLKLVTTQIGKPYSIWASKANQQKFNCATFAQWAILEASGFDLDSDGGMVLPNDILRNPRFDKPGDRIRY